MLYKRKGKKELQEETKDEFWPLYDELNKNFGVPKDKFNIKDARPYIDSYDISKSDGRVFENDLSLQSQKLVTKFLKSYFYDGMFRYKEAARISSSTFIKK